MRSQTQLFCLVVALSLHCLVRAQTKPKQYTNENRPYEFGFTIPGEQHRQESKNEDGLIMGEFGFLTGDGIYHSTVFATDKDGNYRIISMKNTRVGPSPWGKKATTVPPTTTTTTTTTTTPEPEYEFVLDGKPGCSGCLIPTPSPPGAPPRKPFRVPGLKRPAVSAIAAGSPSPVPSQPGSPSPNPTFPRPGGTNPAFPRPGGSTPGRNPASTGNNLPPRGQFQGKPEPAFGSAQPNPLNPNAFRPSPNPGAQFPGSRPGSGSTRPTDSLPDGLPEGMTEDDVMGLLYKFNYTVGFHGHEETGYRNGDKEGEYYTNFRDGTARKVTYTANALGFRPKITIVKVDGEDVPKAETEKEYGLKGYEFKWFNRR